MIWGGRKQEKKEYKYIFELGKKAANFPPQEETSRGKDYIQKLHTFTKKSRGTNDGSQHLSWSYNHSHFLQVVFLVDYPTAEA